MENVLKLAGKIAKNAPIAVRNCKKAINGGISLPIEKAVEVEEKLFGSCFETHDQKEGMACFLSREKPKPKACLLYTSPELSSAAFTLQPVITGKKQSRA